MYYTASAGSVHSVIGPATPMTAIPMSRPTTYYQAPMSAVLPGQAYYPSSHHVSYGTYPASAGVVYQQPYHQQQQVAYAQPMMAQPMMMQQSYAVPTLVLPAHKRRRSHRSRSGFLGYL